MRRSDVIMRIVGEVILNSYRDSMNCSLMCMYMEVRRGRSKWL